MRLLFSNSVAALCLLWLALAGHEYLARVLEALAPLVPVPLP